MSTTSGRVTRVRAKHTRCASPPDSSVAIRSRNISSSPTSASTGTAAESVIDGSATRRLSRTVPGNGVGRWKTIPTRRRKRKGSRPATSSPRNSTRPADGTSSRLQQRNRVDLPEPDGPTNTVTPRPATAPHALVEPSPLAVGDRHVVEHEEALGIDVIDHLRRAATAPSSSTSVPYQRGRWGPDTAPFMPVRRSVDCRGEATPVVPRPRTINRLPRPARSAEPRKWFSQADGLSSSSHLAAIASCRARTDPAVRESRGIRSEAVPLILAFAGIFGSVLAPTAPRRLEAEPTNGTPRERAVRAGAG